MKKSDLSLTIVMISLIILAVSLDAFYPKQQYFFIGDSDFALLLNESIWWKVEAWHGNPDSVCEVKNEVLKLFYNETTGNYYGNSGVFQGNHTDGRYAHQLLVGKFLGKAFSRKYVVFPKNMERGKFWLEVKFKINGIGFNCYPNANFFDPTHARVNLGITLMCAINEEDFNLKAQTLWLDIYFAGYCLNKNDVWVIPKNENYCASNVYTDYPNVHDNDIHAGFFAREVSSQDFGKWITSTIDLGDYISKTLNLITEVNAKTIRVYGFIVFVECLGAYCSCEYDYIKTYVTSP